MTTIALAVLMSMHQIHVPIVHAISTTDTYPSTMTLRVALLPVDPYCKVENDGTYSGFHIDLLNYLADVALSHDNIKLTYNLSHVPADYGRAIDIIANDCNTLGDNSVFHSHTCDSFDIIAGDFFSNPFRFQRVDFSPTWLRSSISSLKKVGHLESMEDLDRKRGTACVLDSTYIEEVVRAKFQNAKYYECTSSLDCIEKVKTDVCSLYLDDELVVRYNTLDEPNMEIGAFQFNTQYLVWPIRRSLDPTMLFLFKKWMYFAVSNSELDELFNTYFSPNSCPIGFIGDNCDISCNQTNSHTINNERCVCVSTKFTGFDCSTEIPEELNLLPTNIKTIFYTLYAIIVACVFICAIWLCLHRDTSQVKRLQPLFLHVVLLGCLVSSSTIMSLAQDNDVYYSDRTLSLFCNLTPWLYSTGFCITFGALFAKIHRIYIIFHNSARLIRIDTANLIKYTFAIIAILLILDVTTLTLWTIFNTPYWTRTVTLRDDLGLVLGSKGSCKAAYNYTSLFVPIGLLHISLLVVSSYFCYLSQNIPSNFSEAKFLSIAILCNLQVYLVGVPVLFLIDTDSSTTFFLISSILWLNNMGVIVCIFANLIYSVMTKKEGVDAGRAVKAFSEHVVSTIPVSSTHHHA